MSTPFPFLLPTQLHSALLSQARTEFPHECCGLLAGRRTEPGVAHVEKGYPLVNALSSSVLFESEPGGMFEAVRDMRRLGLDILAVYHSHPTSAPVPGRTDLERNYSPDVMNLIISLTTDPPEIRVWWLNEEGFRPADWEVMYTARGPF